MIIRLAPSLVRARPGGFEKRLGLLKWRRGIASLLIFFFLSMVLVVVSAASV